MRRGGGGGSMRSPSRGARRSRRSRRSGTGSRKGSRPSFGRRARLRQSSRRWERVPAAGGWAARRVVFCAHVEAAWMGTNEIDTEHLLVGVLRDSENVAVVILEEGLAIPKRGIHKEIWKDVKRGEGSAGQEMRLAARGTRVIE